MAKRGQNEGSVFKRADGRWCAVLSTGYANGKRGRQYIYGKTRREVQDKLTRALVARQDGVAPRAPARLTVGQWLDEWMQQPTDRRVSTIERYRTIIRVHLAPALGPVKLRELTVQHIKAYQRAKLATGLKPGTINNHMICLSAALQDAMRQEHVMRNVVSLAGYLSSPRHQPSILNPEQARRFLQIAAGHPLEALFTVALATGLRIGEAVALKWTDFDFERQHVTIVRQVVREPGGVVIGDVKTTRSRRSIYLPSIAVNALIRHREAQAAFVARWTRKHRIWHEQGFAFTSPRGNPIGVAKVNEELRLLLDQIGLHGRTFHDLRHSFASLLLGEGVSMKVISEMLGHSSIAVTADVYLDVLPALQADAAGRLDQLLLAENTDLP